MFDFMQTKWYLQLIIFIIMPLNGYVVASNPTLGLLLILLQIPFIVDRIEKLI